METQLGRGLEASEREIVLRIIRLRRELGPEEDFARFDRLVGDNLRLILEWPLRWRVSVLDTYTDWGDEVIRRNAHLIVSVVNLTRLAEVDKLYGYRRRRWFAARHMRRIAGSRPKTPWLVDLSLANGDISTNLIRRTTRLLEAAREELQCVLDMGGAVRAVENAYMKQRLVESHTARLRAIESGDLTIVGVNRFQDTVESPLVANRSESILKVDESAEREQNARLEAFRSGRNDAESKRALRHLEDVVKNGGNIMPASIQAAWAAPKSPAA